MNIRQLVFVLSLVLAASAWVTWFEHPNQTSLRRALRDTLPLL